MIVWIEAVGCTNACHSCRLGDSPLYQAFYSTSQLQWLAETWGPLVPLEDPTVHPEFPELLNRHITSPKTTYLGSNGVGIAQATNPKAMFSRLRKYGYEGIHFAVHGLASWHDWLVRRQGAFQAVVQATRLASEAGFYVYWEVYLNRHNLEDVAPLTKLAKQTFDGTPYLNLLGHRVHPYLRWYEQLRPSLRDVQERLPDELIKQRWEHPLEELAEASWLQAWEQDPDSDRFKHFFEPRSWPPSPPFDNQVVSITRDGQVYFDPQCSPPIFLGALPENRNELINRLQRLIEPNPKLRESWPDHLIDEERDLLHPSGYSVRYKAISIALCSTKGLSDAVAALDFCGHF